MKRRTLLAGVATGAVGLSGCLAEGNGGESGDEGNGGGDGDDGEGPPSVGDSSIETTAKDCGSIDASDATAERGGGEVTVEGVIGVSNPCHTAVLERVEIHNRQLVLRVALERDEGGCVMCTGEIEYRATVEVSNAEGLHGTTVEHADGGEHVTNWDESEDSSP